MIIIGDNLEYIAFVKARLGEQFFMFDLGPLRYFLGIEVSSSSDGFFISQEKYIQVLARAILSDERSVETPMELNVHLRASGAHFSSRPIQMLLGLVILQIVIHFQLTVSFLVVLSLPRRRRNRLQSSSSAEAELQAMALLMVEVTWLHWLVEDFGVSVTTLLSDSTCAISIVRDPVKHELSKYCVISIVRQC